MVSTETLRKLLSYNETTGELKWRHRGLDSFKSEREYKRWNTRYANTVAGSRDPSGYHLVKIFGKQYNAHRVIYQYVTGIVPEIIDHKDGNPSNNRFNNLRDTNATMNGRNRALNSNSRTGVPGVCFHTASGKWYAYIKLSGKMINLRYYSDFDDAVKVRKKTEAENSFSPNHGRQ